MHYYIISIEPFPYMHISSKTVETGFYRSCIGINCDSIFSNTIFFAMPYESPT